jgi:acyl carrier protein
MSIRDRVIKAVSERSGVGLYAVSDEHTLIDDMSLDGHDIERLLCDLEKAFSVKINDCFRNGVDTVADIVQVIEGLKTQSGNCDLCGHWAGRLIEGVCPQCQDTYRPKG